MDSSRATDDEMLFLGKGNSMHFYTLSINMT